MARCHAEHQRADARQDAGRGQASACRGGRMPCSREDSQTAPHRADCWAWMPGSRTRADARQANIGRMPMVRVKPDGTAPGGLPGHLRSLGGSSKSSGMMVSHVRRGALTAHSGIRGARPRPFAMHDAQRRKTAWHDAMLSIRNRRFPRKNSRMLCFSCRRPPALVLRRWNGTSPEDCMAGCHAEHQKPEVSKKKQQDAVFFV